MDDVTQTDYFAFDPDTAPIAQLVEAQRQLDAALERRDNAAEAELSIIREARGAKRSRRSTGAKRAAARGAKRGHRRKEEAEPQQEALNGAADLAS